MASDRWLTKNEYSKLRYRAKKIGAINIYFNALWHSVSFEYTTVAFMFKPLQYHVNIKNGHYLNGHFSDKEGAEAIKRDIDKALEFIEILKEFDKTISK